MEQDPAHSISNSPHIFLGRRIKHHIRDSIDNIPSIMFHQLFIHLHFQSPSCSPLLFKFIQTLLPAWSLLISDLLQESAKFLVVFQIGVWRDDGQEEVRASARVEGNVGCESEREEKGEGGVFFFFLN